MVLLTNLTMAASQLFTLPGIAIKLQNLIYSDSSSAQEMADLIALDPALTARLLRLANSSFYNFPAQIETVSKAVTLVGTNEIFNLALATSSVNAFRQLKNTQIDMNQFWQQSIATGLIARNLLEQLHQKNAESAFVFGILHNIGLLVLAEQEPEMTQKLLSQSNELSPWEKQFNQLGFYLSDCGSHLLKDWNLPQTLWEPVRNQHHPEKASEDRAVLSACLHIASRGASSLFEKDYNYLNAIAPCAWELAQLDTENLQKGLDYAEQNTQQIAKILIQAI